MRVGRGLRRGPLLECQRGALQSDSGGVVWRPCGVGADRRIHHQAVARGDIRAWYVTRRKRLAGSYFGRARVLASVVC